MFFDPTFILLIPALVLAFYAQYKVKSTYFKFLKVPPSSAVPNPTVTIGI